MKLPIYQVDAFTDQRFAGNPAAVVPCESMLDDALMQQIAAENNLPETAFVWEAPKGLHIRWFTPTVEVDLCGHATLASAHMLWQHRGYAGERLTFDSRSGPLHVDREDPLLWLDFPADTLEEEKEKGAVEDALGVPVSSLLRGRDDFLAVLETEEQLCALQPDFGALAMLPVRGLIVTAPGVQSDYVCRFFAPQSGIPEDPVTGSAQTSLCVYWTKRLGLGRLHSYQRSPRGGSILCELCEDRVRIGGQAVTYLIGEISC